MSLGKQHGPPDPRIRPRQLPQRQKMPDRRLIAQKNKRLPRRLMMRRPDSLISDRIPNSKLPGPTAANSFMPSMNK